MSNRHHGMRVVALLFAVSVAGCVVTPAKPLTEADHGYGQSEDEHQLILRANRVEDELRRHGLLFRDPAVESYVQQVAARLIPPSAAQAAPFHFAVIRDPVVNAFALPNGGIYLTVGLMARLENEAQLAQVLSHEIAHVVQRHGLLGMRNRRATIITAQIMDLALFGTSIAYLPALGALAGYSQENESEADRIALEYMAHAGYSLKGAEQLFRVIQEVKPKESIWGSAYSSHPDNQKRAQDTREIINSGRLVSQVDGRVGQQEYHAVRDRLIIENIQLKLNVRQYELAAEAADRALVEAPTSPQLHYYRGEADRLRAEDPVAAAREHAWIHDKTNNAELVEEFRGRKTALLASAKLAYQQALKADPGFADAYRGLGLVAYAEGDKKTAREMLNRYLASGHDISDRRYINNIIGRLDTP